MMESFIHELPCDLQTLIHNKVIELRKPKKVLTIDLQQDIESFHLLKTVIQKYESIYDHDDECLESMETDMVFILNNDESFATIIHPNLQRAFPNFSHSEIVHHLQYRTVTLRHIQQYWFVMSPIQRMRMFLSFWSLNDD